MTERRRNRSRHPWWDHCFADPWFVAGLAHVRLQFSDPNELEPGDREIRRAGTDLRHRRHFLHRHADRGAGRSIHRAVSHRIVPDVAAPPDRHRHRVARRHSQHHLRYLGPVRVRPVPAAIRAAVLDHSVRLCAGALHFVRGAPLWHRHPDRRPDPRHHGAAVHHLDFARRVRSGAAGAQGGGLWTGLHDLGSGALRRAALRARRRDRRRHARAWPCARRNHGGDLRDRQCAPHFRFDLGAGNDDIGHHRQRIHRGGRRPLYLCADRARSHPVRDHVHRARFCAPDVDASQRAGRSLTMVMISGASSPLYAKRRRRNVITMGLSFAETAFGLSWLVLILGVLLWEGFSGLSLAVFTEMTPPPGAAGSLLNPIIGSLVMTSIAVAIGTPLGMLAGTYMAEYGRYDKLTTVMRFINDILLSAPSIVIGLFVYEIMVAQMGHFSGWAGAVSLAVIVVPVVVRTTEDMLTLVPDTLREAAASIGLPRALLFTALNNQFWSTNMNAPVASLPVVIFQFALSPYKDWQKLAWTGALIITLAVLALSIIARLLAAQRKSS